MANRPQSILGALLFSLGLLLGIALASVAVWGDLEAALFDTSSAQGERLASLSCPVLITRGETGRVSATFSNPGPVPEERAVRIRVSARHVTLMREESVRTPLAPGAAQRLSWPIDARDAAFGGLLILARVSALRQSAFLPAQTGSCGILVVDLPLVSGNAVVIGWLLLSLAGMIGGGWLWLAGHARRTWQTRRAVYLMAALGIVALLAIVVGLLGMWALGVLVLALILLLLVAVLAQMILQDSI